MHRKNTLKPISMIIFLVLMLQAMMFPMLSRDQSVRAESELPPIDKPVFSESDINSERWMMLGENVDYLEIAGQARSIAETDDFGYAWDDTIPLDWIDATEGTNTGMIGSSAGQAHGPVSIGFDFPFYEFSFDQVYIAASGYLSLSPSDSWPNQSQIPASSDPNNVIAPYWAPLYLSSGTLFGQVYYLKGGEAPDRYFVAEWYDVTEAAPGGGATGDDNFHFQVILYENGDIRFQYNRMEYFGSSYCGSAGIENSTGEDGLSYLSLCTAAPSGRAVHFYRPAPAARMRVSPNTQSRLIGPGETLDFPIVISNLGDFGEDVFELDLDSNWPGALLDDDKVTLLVDSNDNGWIDTGPIPQGESKTIYLSITAPDSAVIGDYDLQFLEFMSILDDSVGKEAEIRVAIPSRFTQSFRDDATGAMRVMLTDPQVRDVKQVTSDAWWGYNPAIIETQSGDYLYLWQRWMFGSDGETFVSKLEYALIDYKGRVLKEISTLMDDDPDSLIVDEDPVLTLAPNGEIGLAWRRRIIKNDNGGRAENWNIYFAILDGQGVLTQPAINLTNNELWIPSDTIALGAPYFWNIRLSVNQINHYALIWHRESHEAPTGGCLADCKLNNIFYALVDENGNPIKDITKLTKNEVSDHKTLSSPTITAVNDDHWLLVYNHINGGMAYVVLDSQGEIFRTRSFIPETGNGWSPVALQPIGGEQIILAWTAWTGSNPQIHSTTINSLNFQPSSEIQVFETPQASTGGDYAALTPDALGNVILTWMDFSSNDRQHLYYALLDAEGGLVTPPLFFYTAQRQLDEQGKVETGFTGVSSTTNRLFLDVPIDFWAGPYIERLYDAGWTTGITTDPPLYAPFRSTTRAEIAVFFVRVLGFDLPEASGTIFGDVSDDYWAASAIEKLYAEGLTKGCDDSPELLYCPNKTTSRAEMAVFLARVLYGNDAQLDPPTGIFDDVPTSHWAAAEIEQLYRDGITAGCGTAPLRFCPDGSTNRAEIAAFLVRTFNLP